MQTVEGGFRQTVKAESRNFQVCVKVQVSQTQHRYRSFFFFFSTSLDREPSDYTTQCEANRSEHVSPACMSQGFCQRSFIGKQDGNFYQGRAVGHSPGEAVRLPGGLKVGWTSRSWRDRRVRLDGLSNWCPMTKGLHRILRNNSPPAAPPILPSKRPSLHVKDNHQLIQVNGWQKPLQYCKVISLQLNKLINFKKRQSSVNPKWNHSITQKRGLRKSQMRNIH